jgi:2-haloacid dehalogenase
VVASPRPFDLGAYEALTFDCYRTLIDWESGILAALGAARSEGWPASGEELLERFAAHEAEAERGEYRPYRDVLARTIRGIADDFRVAVSDTAVRRFSESVGDWPPFQDSGPALERLSSRFRLGVISNCDGDLFAASNERLGARFDWVMTAERVGSYKPDPANFERALETIAVPRGRIMHVAQSHYHDLVPAKRLGMATVWIDRRHNKRGFGATPAAEAEPDLAFASMASFADAAVPGVEASATRDSVERVDEGPVGTSEEA